MPQRRDGAGVSEVVGALRGDVPVRGGRHHAARARQGGQSTRRPPESGACGAGGDGPSAVADDREHLEDQAEQEQLRPDRACVACDERTPGPGMTMITIDASANARRFSIGTMRDRYRDRNPA